MMLNETALPRPIALALGTALLGIVRAVSLSADDKAGVDGEGHDARDCGYDDDGRRHAAGPTDRVVAVGAFARIAS
jgi:hypothetical protein